MTVNEARGLLRDADSVIVLTGAGVSAESGVPTFRGEDGLWKSHRPEELATPRAFARDPRLVWEWYGWRRSKVAACDPNPGHLALARWALTREGVRIVTQNVDGLHEVAARNVAEELGLEPEPGLPLELHGSLFRVRCTACGQSYGHREPVDASSRESLPACRSCGELLRPAVVWFGEGLPAEVLERSFELARTADLCLVVGTSAVVQPAASLPLRTRESGGRIVEVNPDSTPLSEVASALLRGPAGELLPPLLEGLRRDP